MAAKRPFPRGRIIAFVLATLIVALAIYAYATLLGPQMRVANYGNFVKIPFVALWALLAYLAVRFVNAAIFDLADVVFSPCPSAGRLASRNRQYAVGILPCSAVRKANKAGF